LRVRRGSRARRQQHARPDAKMTCVSIDWTVQIGAATYRVLSSDLYADPLPAPDWPRQILDTVTKTRGSRGGAGKGRVLYLLYEPAIGGCASPVAALAYHVQSANEITIRDASSSLPLKHMAPEFVRTLLLCLDGILRKYPGRRGSAHLRWAAPPSE